MLIGITTRLLQTLNLSAHPAIRSLVRPSQSVGNFHAVFPVIYTAVESYWVALRVIFVTAVSFPAFIIIKRAIVILAFSSVRFVEYFARFGFAFSQFED